MTTDYNAIAQEYKQSKQQPWRTHIECFTFFELIGDLTGLSVLDLACGEGYYTRQLKRGGAGRVVGVDLSDGMIDLARAQEAREPLGIEYLVSDAKSLHLGERFDLVVAGYLLNYAATRDELLAMCQSIARALKPDCRFLSVNNNPAQPRATFSLGRKYGFDKTAPEEPRDGTPIEWTFFLDGQSFAITNYQLSIATHEWAFHEAGIRQVRWHPPRVSPEGTAEYGHDFWRDFLDHPPVIFIECK
jgi:ubiquinone/menaquinone biosynthesis C-methylase UbiE